MSQNAFFFDESRCIDCRACAVACRDWNGVEQPDCKLLRVFSWEEGVFPELMMRTVFVPCYHCEKPACGEACSNGAIIKEGRFGAVLIDSERCTGCGDCKAACPYSVPQMVDDASGPRAMKCTMCYERLAAGEMPVCVNSCVARALDFGPLDIMQQKYGDRREAEGLPSAELTRPAVIFKPAEPKKTVVRYDIDKARALFGVHKDWTSPSDEASRGVEGADRSIIGRTGIDLKAEKDEMLRATRNDEW